MRLACNRHKRRMPGLLRPLLAGFLVTLAASFSLRAQSALYTIDGDDKLRLVGRVDDRTPYTFEKEKKKYVLPTPSDANGKPPRRYRLQGVEEFWPAFVNVEVVKGTFGQEVARAANRVLPVFHFTANLATDFPLKDCFIVIAFDSGDLDRKFWVQELKDANLREHKTIAVDIPLPEDTKPGKYEIHIFSQGAEVFNSTMPRETIDAALGKMVEKRTKTAKDARPQLLMSVQPRYPEALAGSKPAGQAVVSCVIAASGQPQKIQLKSASDPAFGQAAVTALSQWWFVPAVVGGKAVDSPAELPFAFTPPK